MNLEVLWSRVLKDTTVEHDSIHGAAHWARVERNGLYVARMTGANQTIVQLFALFHDCRRVNQDMDPGHGLRGAEYAARIRDELIDIPSDDFDKLYYACQWHTDRTWTDDATIAACWDADRLDIGRVGYDVHPRYMNSEPARETARNMTGPDDEGPLGDLPTRNWKHLTAPVAQACF